MKRIVVLVLTLSLHNAALADEGREFLMSCTYGILTGALVGAATLAIEDIPENKLHRVSRGASLGLYAGIILGTYVTYVLPAQLERKANEAEEIESQEIYIDGEDAPQDIKNFDPSKYQFDDGYEYQETEDQGSDDYGIILPPPKFIVYPLFENNRLTGAGINMSVYRF